MHPCDLQLHVEGAERGYAPGETIRGHVTVTAREAVEIKGVFVRLQWRTHGRGSPRMGPVAEVTLAEAAAWPAGFSRQYAFEFVAPSGPSTYHGTIVNLDHYVSARVESGWTLAGSAETTILLTPPPAGAPYDRGPAAREPEAVMRSHDSESAVVSVLVGLMVGLPGIGIFLVGIAIALGLVGVSAPKQPIPPAVFVMGFGTVMMAVAVAGIYILQKRRLARRRLGDPRVEISPVHAHAGERVRVSVILRPPQDLELERASIALKGLERALTSESRNWVKHQFHRHDTALSAPPRLTAGQDVHLAGELTVPAVAAPSFDADSNYVNWSIELKVEPRGWPAWQREFPIVVWP